MSNHRSRSATWPGLMLSALAALGLASAARAQTAPEVIQIPAAAAPAEKASPPSADAWPGTSPVSGVTVTGPRRDSGLDIPPGKAAEYEKQVKKDEAFRAYRKSTPKMTADSHDVGDPNDDSKDFPGLQTYLPQ